MGVNLEGKSALVNASSCTSCCELARPSVRQVAPHATPYLVAMNLTIDNWDDLRILLASVRAGSVAVAARQLGFDRTTVSRRLAAFEEQTGSKLFDRLRGGILLTDEGSALVRGAEKAEAVIKAVELNRNA